MEQTTLSSQITTLLEEQIDKAKKKLDDFHERKIIIQIITWIFSEDLKANLENNDTHIVLSKASSWDIVFPSWHVDPKEFDEGEITPKWLADAAIREFKEELYWLISINESNFIDVYEYLAFENKFKNKEKKYVQFRVVAKIHPQAAKDLDRKFAAEYKKAKAHRKPSAYREHDNCYIVSYKQANHYLDVWRWRLKQSTEVSLKLHYHYKNEGKYADKI